MVWEVVKLDIKKSAIMVLGVPRRPTKGMCIGSPVAAGGAAICAAFKETLALRCETADVQKELRLRTFVRRWLDDLWVVWEKVLSKAARDFLRRLQGEYFYGPTLALKRVLEAEPFGFVVFAEEGKHNLTVRSRMAFIQEGMNKPGPGWGERRSVLHGGGQFRSDRQEKAAITGHLARYLDMSSEEEAGLVLGAVRLVAELIRVGTPRKAVESAVKKMAFRDQPELKTVLPAVHWKEEMCERFAEGFDRWEAARREFSRGVMVCAAAERFDHI